VKSWVANSVYRKNWAHRTLLKELYKDHPGAKLGILGLAYKQDTHSTKNSPSLALLDALANKDVTVYDPVVKGSVAPQAKEAADALEACVGMDAIAIMTPWDEFACLAPAEIASVMRGRLVLDPYAMLKTQEVKTAGLIHRRLGVAAAH